MGWGDTFHRLSDRVRDSVGNFLYPRDEYQDAQEPPRRQARPAAGMEAPVPQTPQVTAPEFDFPQTENPAQVPPASGGFRQGYVPPASQEQPVTPDNLVYLPGVEQEKPHESESVVRVISVRSVSDCYSAITQLRLGDMVVLVMDQVGDTVQMRHYVDMLSGACYSLRATITKLSRHGSYLVCPQSCRVYVDAVTSQLNAPSRQMPRPNPFTQTQGMGTNPYTQAPAAAGNPYAQAQNAGGNPYMQAMGANAYAQPQGQMRSSYAPRSAEYAPPPQRDSYYASRQEAQAPDEWMGTADPYYSNRPTVQQNAYNGYVPDDGVHDAMS